ncbi:disco-interacting protein 2 homolog A-like [Corticium candelabrum]|uniref:disco-interacting protein 2 homolog A-like n=1 Tax=Corticium candelabrum TaxID=121492 RepID=UPI002E2714C4|nr:disco-interacting protein 2 homolog A-like [Corticium candelabrum]
MKWRKSVQRPSHKSHSHPLQDDIEAKVAIVKLEGPPYLCQTDEVRELCVSSQYTGTSYWGPAGKSTNVSKVQPLASNGQPHLMSLYV